MESQTTVTGQGQRLPTEVCERIIGHIGNTSVHRFAPRIRFNSFQPTLYACCLTCRAWVPRCRYHLYESIELRDQLGLVRLLSSLACNPSNGVYVLALEIVGQDTSGGFSWLYRALTALPKYFKSLQRIKFTHLDLYNLHPQFFRLCSQFKSVTVLQLHVVTFDTVVDLGRLAVAFPNLAQLVCSSASWSKPYDLGKGFRGITSSKLHISSIEMSIPRIETDVTGFTELVSLLAKVPVFATPVTAPLRKGQRSSTLQSLQIRMPQTTRGPLFDWPLDLNHCSNLKHLYLSHLEPNSMLSLWVAKILSGITSNHVETITLQFVEPSEVDWNVIGEALKLPHLESVRRFVIATHFQSVLELRPKIQATFPDLLDRGILAVKTTALTTRESFIMNVTLSGTQTNHPLIRQIVDELQNPPITETPQPPIFFTSADQAHLRIVCDGNAVRFYLHRSNLGVDFISTLSDPWQEADIPSIPLESTNLERCLLLIRCAYCYCWKLQQPLREAWQRDTLSATVEVIVRKLVASGPLIEEYSPVGDNLYAVGQCINVDEKNEEAIYQISLKNLGDTGYHVQIFIYNMDLSIQPFYKSPVQQSDAADFDLGPGKVLAFDGTPNGAGQPVSFVIGKNQSQRIDASIFKIIFSTSRIEPDDNDTQYPQARWDVLYIPFLITCTTRSNPGALGATNSAYSAPRF